MVFKLGWSEKRPMIDHKEFGQLLSVARQSRTMSQSDVARNLGITPDAYAEIERGAASMSLLLLARLRQQLDLDVNVLLEALPVDVAQVTRRKRKSSHATRRKFGRYHQLGRQLLKLRIASELTQDSVAYALDLSLGQVIRIEGGHRLPSLERFAQLRRLFGFDANALLDCLLEKPSNEPFRAFALIIRTSRESLGMSFKQAARRVGCHPNDYRQMECGAKLPTMDVFMQMHRVLRFDADMVLRAVWEWKHHRGKHNS